MPVLAAIWLRLSPRPLSSRAYSILSAGWAIAGRRPTPEENPRHAGLELWMAAYGHQIVGRPASWFDRRDDNNR
jgi:hypothetical protein